MSRARYLVAFVLLVLSAGLAQADGLLYQLPKDGTWATYQLDGTAQKMGKFGIDATDKGTLRIASVGRVTANKQPCRWIEVQLDVERNIGEQKFKRNEAYKVLIPEQFLAKNQSPLEDVIHAWRQWEDGKSEQMVNPNNINTPLPLILSKPWENVKHLEKAEVKSKLGSRNCEGVEGTIELRGERRYEKWELENRLHTDSPFGVVTSRWKLAPRQEGGGAMTWNLKLVDFGENAKSKMPDAK